MTPGAWGGAVADTLDAAPPATALDDAPTPAAALALPPEAPLGIVRLIRLLEFATAVAAAAALIVSIRVLADYRGSALGALWFGAVTLVAAGPLGFCPAMRIARRSAWGSWTLGGTLLAGLIGKLLAGATASDPAAAVPFLICGLVDAVAIAALCLPRPRAFLRERNSADLACRLAEARVRLRSTLDPNPWSARRPRR